MKRRWLRWLVLAIVFGGLTACGDADGDGATATTIGATGPELDQPVVVASPDGVFQIGPDGRVAQLVDGAVAVAVDDSQGGLLYQLESGRRAEGDDRSTIVWWIPQDASAPQDLLVPAPSSGHRLTLNDAYPTADGFAVLYTRHDTSGPPDEIVDSLRRFDVPARTVTDVYAQGAFEHGFAEPTVGGQLISLTWFDQVSSVCDIYDLAGRATDLVPQAASDPRLEQQVSGCRLSPDGTRLAFAVEQDDRVTVHLWRLDGSEEARFVVDAVRGRIGPIDLSEEQLLVNLGRDGSMPAVVFDLDGPESPAVELPLRGIARFATSSITVGDAAAQPEVESGEGPTEGAPSYHRYGPDGLFAVRDGLETRLDDRGVRSASADLSGGVIYRLEEAEGPDGLLRLEAGAAEPIVVREGLEPFFTGYLADRPTLFTIGPAAEAQAKGGELQCVTGLDLNDDSEVQPLCFDAGADGGWSVRSAGRDRFVGVEWIAVGGLGTDTRLGFWEAEGTRVEVEANPIPARCAPCTLSARLSPDGSLLAYSHWPTAFWDVEVGDGDYEQALDDWWATAADVPVTLAVVDLRTGVERWRSEAPAAFGLTDFDGRYVIATPGRPWRDEPGSLIFDIDDAGPPITVAGYAVLVR